RCKNRSPRAALQPASSRSAAEGVAQGRDRGRVGLAVDREPLGRLKAPQGCAGLGPELAVDLAEVVAEPAQAPLHAAELVVRIEVAERELVLLLLLALALARDHSQDRRGRADRQRLIDEPVTVGLALELAALIVLEPVSFTGP